MTDLGAAWTVLETEIVDSSPTALRSIDTEARVGAGAVRAAVDGRRQRHLLIPLAPGEAVAEDRTGRGVQLWRVTVDGLPSLSLVCQTPVLNEIFERLAQDVLIEAEKAQSPAKRTAEVLSEWKELLAAARDSGVLGDQQIIGLLGELLCLEQVLLRDPLRRIDSWSGPTGHQHDFICGEHALEIKTSTAREARIIEVSSVDQLDPRPASSLCLVYQRMRPVAAPRGETLPGVVKRIVDLGVNEKLFLDRLVMVGYSVGHEGEYRNRSYELVERRIYDVEQEAFPRIVRASFHGSQLPSGTQHLHYEIDLSNEPPRPLPEAQIDDFWRLLAGSQ